MAWLGDCDKSLVRLLTNALVSDCVDPLRAEVSARPPPPETLYKQNQYKCTYNSDIHKL